MSKKVLGVGVVILVFSLFCIVAQASEPGVEERPNVVHTGKPKMTVSPIYEVQSVAPVAAQPPVYAPEPVFVPSAVSAPKTVYAPVPKFIPSAVCAPPVCNVPCANAPYQVTVEYEPIQPIGGSYTYCTCLPYGCPDGAPIVNGVCGASCGTYGSCGVICDPCASCGNIVGDLFSATLGLSGTIVSNAMCAVKTGSCGILSTAGGMVSCLLTGSPNSL